MANARNDFVAFQVEREELKIEAKEQGSLEGSRSNCGGAKVAADSKILVSRHHRHQRLIAGQ